MEWLLAVTLFLFLAFLVYEDVLDVGSLKAPSIRKRLCDYSVAGSVFEDIPSALARGVRLLEVHVYADEQDKPVVAKKPLNDGYDYAEDNVSFEQVCIMIANDAFPSQDPFILSIVPHTDKSVVLNRIAEHLSTTVHRHLITNKDVQTAPLDNLANALVIVSGGNISGTALEPLVNLNWNESGMRRLSYQQALHPRDPYELVGYNRDNITLVSPDAELKTINANPDEPKAFGCQWNLFDKSGRGFVEKSAELR